MVHRVTDVPVGAYEYTDSPAALTPLAAAPSPIAFQGIMRAANLNVVNTAALIFLVGQTDLRDSGGVARAYRIQQMMTGAALDAAALVAADAGLTAHPVFGFDALEADRLFALGAGVGTLALIFLGPSRPRSGTIGQIHP